MLIQESQVFERKASENGGNRRKNKVARTYQIFRDHRDFLSISVKNYCR